MTFRERVIQGLRGFVRESCRTTGIGIAAALLLVPMTTAPIPASADSCDAGSNPIVCENSKPGNPWQDWDIQGAGDSTIQGFATDISVNVGSQIDFKIDTDATKYSIDIYRTGWYQGLGARKIDSIQPAASLPQHQPECLSDVATELTDCGTWAVSAAWQVPAEAVSGVYLAKLTRTDTGGSSHITFIVRDDSSHSDVLFQTSDPTWHAYNKYGGSDFYQGAANGRAYKISYNRPFETRNGVEARDFYFGAEYPLVRFLERNGYDVSYFSGVDTDRRGEELLNHNTVLSVGHDEYWSAKQRSHLEEARDAGVNLQFLTGNEGYWRTRYEPSTTDDADYRTLVSYKETWSNYKIDPSPEWTGTWRDPRFSPQDKGGGKPENALTGTAYMVNDGLLPVSVNSEEGKLRLWRDTGLASQPPGAVEELAPNTIGYESNEDVDNGFRPAGLIHLSTTKGEVPQYLRDFGNVVTPGETTHHLTMYKAPSGARVFSAGSIQWTWGLDDWHPGEDQPGDPRMQQAQVNLLADMGAQPETLMDGLVSATATSDETPPVISVTSKPSKAVKNGDEVDLAGTATDAGGVVAGVEYSVDGGSSWRPATGGANWTINYIQQGMGEAEVLVRAIDDSGNYPATAAVVALDVEGPYSVFGKNVPARVDAEDTDPVELGLHFSPQSDGYISGVRFFKSTANVGTHTGSLWAMDGRRLARATFVDESADGWQQTQFSEPVRVKAGADYVVSYAAPNGGYSADELYFSYRGILAAPLTVPGGFGVESAGLYDTNGGFPASSFRQSNYYVDAIFESLDAVPLAAGGHQPADTAVSVPTTTPISTIMSKPVSAESVNIGLADKDGNVAGSTTYDPETLKATFEPSASLKAGTEYTATATAEDPKGNVIQRGSEWSFRTAKPDRADGDCPCGLFSDSTLPDVGLIDENTPLTLGTRFATDTSGELRGMEYYKAEGNDGPHTGKIYRMDGSTLAEVEFPNTSVSGWQYAKFASPIRLNADTEYVAAYTTQGSYSVAIGALSDPTVAGPLRTGEQAGQFVYADGFPAQSISTSYLVDVSFQPDAAPMALASRTPEPGSVDVPLDSEVKATFNRPLAPGYTLTAESSSGNIVGDVALSANGKTLTFSAEEDLPKGENILVTLKNVSSNDGSTMPNIGWAFGSANGNNKTSVLGNTEPTELDPHDPDAVELGLRLKASEALDVTALRYYRGPNAGGTHTGSIWNAAGERIAQVTFTNETASGWQMATLDNPVRIEKGDVFTVSYHAPEGGYAYTPSGLSEFTTNGSLKLEGANGLFAYGEQPTLPNESWNDANYFVDLIYAVAPPQTSSPSETPSSSTSSPAPSPSSSPSVAPSDSADPSPSPSNSAGPSPSPSESTDPIPTEALDLLGDSTVSAPVAADNEGVELGLEFTTTETITAHGIRYYRPESTGEETTGHIYDASGTQLGSVEFIGGTSAGWQYAALPTPIGLPPGDYTISYFTEVGTYVFRSGTDFSDLSTGPVTVSQENGKYRYGESGGTSPTSTWKRSNYFVDLIFTSS